MNDREKRNPRQQEQRQNTGAGSRQQEQATAGGSMRDDDEEFGESSRQMEQQGGTYRPEGDRGLDFESDDSGELGIGQAEQQSGRDRQDDQRRERSRQQGDWESDEEDF